MKLSLAELVDPRLLPLVEPSRAFYESRAAGWGPRGAVPVRSFGRASS